MKFYIEYPILLALIIPVVILLVILLQKNFMKFKTLAEKIAYKKSLKGRRIFITVTRCLIVIYLMVALSSPYTLHEEVVKGDYSLKILVDNSTSMGLFDNSVADRLFDQLKDKVPVTKIPIALGEYSPIGDAIINNMHGDDNLLLVTDGQNNNGKDLAHVMFFANLLNSTISALEIQPVNNDYSVVIEGPTEAIKGSDNTFLVRVSKAGNPSGYTLRVSIDEVPISTERVEPDLYRFTKSFSEGYHKITARLEVSDYFSENNIFHKSLHVLPKPSILYVTEKDPRLVNLLNPVYEIEKKTVIPSNLESYASIIIDDINEKVLDSKTELLSDYVIEGGGLFVIGGENSFDRGDYQDSIFESILPVKVGEAGYGGEMAANIVLVLDISQSTGQGFSRTSDNKKVDVEKALAIEILKDISLFDRVGVVAFNHKAYIISQMGMLADIEGNVTQKISSLHDTGGTLVYAGLKQAQYLLNNVLGSRNIILISDGVDSLPSLSLDLAKQFEDQGIKIYSVGVGEATNSAFLQTLAVETGGAYFEPAETEKLKILFGEREEMPPESSESLVSFNNQHFITKGLTLTADVSGYNNVVKKSAAQMLVSMGDGKPILSVWRYGLGRVAVMSTDSGDKWANQLLGLTNSKLITRTINWAIGDPQKNLDFYIRVDDARIGVESKIIVKSDKVPTSNILNFEKADEEVYVAYFTPEKIGYQNFFKSIMAVNNPIEYQGVGLNSDLKDFVGISGGRMFNPNEVDEIVDFVRSNSVRKKTTPQYFRWPFILVVLIILLIEIFIRKIIESRRQK
jgi:uncharacterized membrane protein